ncbi:MAG: hypothetical protein ACKN9U_01105 [Pirellulaceae bacterium]
MNGESPRLRERSVRWCSESESIWQLLRSSEKGGGIESEPAGAETIDWETKRESK